MPKVEHLQLTQCDACQHPIYPDAVFREVPVPQQHGFVALVYKCTSCGEVGKLAATYSDWEQVSNDFEALEHERQVGHDKLIKEFQFDLDQEITVEFLEELFASYGPAKFVEVKHKCNCKECKERRGNV